MHAKGSSELKVSLSHSCSSPDAASSWGLSLQGKRLMLRILEQLTRRFLRLRRLKGSRGTLEMPVLSQMILAREAVRSTFLWLGLNTP